MSVFLPHVESLPILHHGCLEEAKPAIVGIRNNSQEFQLLLTDSQVLPLSESFVGLHYFLHFPLPFFGAKLSYSIIQNPRETNVRSTTH